MVAGILSNRQVALMTAMAARVSDKIINILDNSGAVLLASWPAIIDPLDNIQQIAGQTEYQPSTDAMLYCAPSDFVRPGNNVEVIATGQDHVIYSIESRAAAYVQGDTLRCRLTEMKRG